MFASQLLRILQTIPSDVKYETCVNDSAEEDMTTNENQNGRLHDSKSLGREADPLAFGSKELYQLNGLRRDTHPTLFEVKGRDGYWNPKFLDDLSMDNQNGTSGSTAEEFPNGHLYRLSSLEEDADSLSSDPYAKEKELNGPEHKFSVADEEFLYRNESEPRDSRSPYIAALDLFADKMILECEPPDLIVCKEINVVKDIRVDEGMPVNNKILIDSSKDDQSGNSFPGPLNDDSYYKATGVVDEKLLVSDGLATPLEYTKGVSFNEHGSEDEIDGTLLAQAGPKSPSQCSFNMDTAKDFNQEDSMQKGKTNFAATYASKEGSFIDKTLPLQEFGTRSFLRSFLNSLDGEDNTVKQLPDQISSGKVVSKGPAASSAEAVPREDVKSSSLCYNSKEETGSITFNFNSPAPLEVGDTNGRTENIDEQSVDSRDVLDQKDADAGNLSDASQVNCNSSKNTSTRKIHEQSLYTIDGSPNDFMASCPAQGVSSKDISSENAHSQSLDRKDENPVLLSSCGQTIGSHVLNPEHRDPDNDSVSSLWKYDEGESSFSATGLITCSGAISRSGSLSLRSDGSATSGRSFAFPILQPEWNSSPVRMTKADGRHFRKHKGWRSGILCCRF